VDGREDDANDDDDIEHFEFWYCIRRSFMVIQHPNLVSNSREGDEDVAIVGSDTTGNWIVASTYPPPPLCRTLLLPVEGS
jgi:hypothetical protein